MFCCQEVIPLTEIQLNTMVTLTSTAESQQMVLHQPLVEGDVVVPVSKHHHNERNKQPPPTSTSSTTTSSTTSDTEIETPPPPPPPSSPSSSKKRARYSVHFHPQEPIQIHEIPCRAELYIYWKGLYITKQDQLASQQEIVGTLRAYAQEQQQQLQHLQQLLHQNEQTEGIEVDLYQYHYQYLYLDERIRGLEAFLPQDAIRAKRMKEAIQLIITRQTQQKQQQQQSKQAQAVTVDIDIDTAWLETSYKPFSEAASTLAHQRGIKDLQAVPASWGGAPTKSVMIR